MELQLQRLCKQYGKKSAVDHVSVHLRPGYTACLAQTAREKQH